MPNDPANDVAQPAPAPAPASAEQTPNQANVSADIATAMIFLVFVGLIGLVVSALFARWWAVEWSIIAWFVEMAGAWKARLTALFALVTVLVAVFTDLHKSSRRLRPIAIMLAIGVLACFAAYYLSTRGFAPTQIGEHFETLDCSLENPAWAGFDDTEARAAQRKCQVDLLGAFWLSWVTWLAVTLATVLGINSRPMEIARKLLRPKPDSAKERA